MVLVTAVTMTVLAAAQSAGTATAAALRPAAAPDTSVTDALTFLDQMMDLYATGSTTRLVQSFSGGALKGFT